MPAISVTSLCSAAESIYEGNTLNFLIFPEFVPLWLSFESSLLHLWFLKTLSGSEHRPWLFCGFLCFQALLVVDDNGAVRSNIWSPLSGRILTGQRFSNSVFNPRSHGQRLPHRASCPIPNIIIRPHRSIFIISVINGHHDGMEHDHRHQRRFPR